MSSARTSIAIRMNNHDNGTGVLWFAAVVIPGERSHAPGRITDSATARDSAIVASSIRLPDATSTSIAISAAYSGHIDYGIDRCRGVIRVLRHCD